jgi:Fusaric acid resistance protein family
MTPVGTFAQACRTAQFALERELAAWKPSRARATFGTEAMLSVALSVAFANALGLSDTWRAAISGFAVMQTSFAGSLERAAHRMMGTVIGAALGTVVGPWIGDRPWLFVPALGVIGGVTVYRANGSKAAYAWILGGVTALMVTYEAHSLASIRATASFAALRIAEVAVGTLACLLVASVFHFGPKWYRTNRTPLQASNAREVAEASAPSAMVLTPPLKSVRPTRMLLSLEAAVSITILASLTYVMHLPGFAQTMVTAIAMLIVPPRLAADSTRQPVMERWRSAWPAACWPVCSVWRYSHWCRGKPCCAVHAGVDHRRVDRMSRPNGKAQATWAGNSPLRSSWCLFRIIIGRPTRYPR